VVQPDTPEAIARPCVLGEAKLNFASKTIGRENAEYGGVKVYAELTRYIQNQINGHRFSEVIAQLRAKMLSKPKEHLHHLKKVVGDASGEKGQANTVDCDYAMPLLEPVFTLICGTRQAYEDCGFPSAMKSLFLVLDRNLVKAMLEWRRGQELFLKEKLGEKLEALKDGNGKLDDKKAKQLLASYGWIADFHHPLKSSLHNPRPFSFEYINTCRINFFTGIIFNRCISPFLAPTAAPGESRDTSAGQALIKISGAANKIFIKRYKEFAQSFVDYSNKFLHDAEAEELRGLEKKEERFEKVARSRKAVAAGDKAIAPRKGHASAPTLLQGKDFLEAMKKEASLVEQGKLDDPSGASANSRADQRHWIDDFRKRHGDAFKVNPALDLEFSKRLRRWRKKEEPLGETAFKEKLAKLYRHATREVERSTTALLTNDQNVQPTVVVASKAEQTVSSPRVSQAREVDETDINPKREMKVAKASRGLIALNDVQLEAVDKLLKDKRRRAYLERFPALEAALKQNFLAWCNEGTGGSPALALQKIFEDLVMRHFFNAMQLRQKVSDADLDKLKKACEEWPSKANGWEKPRPEEMSFIWRTKVCAIPAPAYSSSINFRMAEAAIDALLSDAEAGLELADDTLKNAFLNKAQLWLDSGAMGMGPETIIRGYYEDALIKHFIKAQEPALPPSDIVNLNEAAKREGRNDPDRILTTAALRSLLQRLRDRAKQT
jgi:hypothetical protein